jgi:Phosphotriesterase family
MGIGRDPLGLSRIAPATGLNIVMGTGYYVDAAHPLGFDTLSESDLHRKMVEDIRDGIGDTQVNAGLVGEIGCSWPLTQNEKKVLGAAAKTLKRTLPFRFIQDAARVPQRKFFRCWLKQAQTSVGLSWDTWSCAWWTLKF